MDTEIVTVKTEGTTLSALLARHYRRVFTNAAAIAYGLNQDLAREGPYLPVGRGITVPTLDAMKTRSATGTPIVDLFA